MIVHETRLATTLGKDRFTPRHKSSRQSILKDQHSRATFGIVSLDKRLYAGITPACPMNTIVSGLAMHYYVCSIYSSDGRSCYSALRFNHFVANR
jgi:hypothetical protein